MKNKSLKIGIIAGVGFAVWYFRLKKGRKNIGINQIKPDFSSIQPISVEEPLENTKHTIMPVNPDIFKGTGGHKQPTTLGDTDAFRIVDPNTNLKYVKLTQDRILFNTDNYNQGDTVLQGAIIKYAR